MRAGFVLKREGSTKLKVPAEIRRSAFYNPRMELCRDVDIACLAAFLRTAPKKERRYADALAGTGVRGVRAANELGVAAEINDLSVEAYTLINENIRLNGLEGLARAHNKDANVFLSERRYEIVDLDPFGSPVPFLDSACRSVTELLLVTATDTAPLCGAHPAGPRKYEAIPLKTEYHREMGTRILLGAVIRRLAAHEKAATPLLAYARRHFVRLVLKIERGARRADAALKRLGFVAHCFGCGNRRPFSCEDLLESEVKRRCDHCGGGMKIAGPLYLGSIRDETFCNEALRALDGLELGMRRQVEKILKTSRDELDIPFYYEHHALCKRLKITPLPLEAVLEALRAAGFSASKTVFSDTGFKTDASIEKINEVLRRSVT